MSNRFSSSEERNKGSAIKVKPTTPRPGRGPIDNNRGSMTPPPPPGTRRPR